jgi:murein L,D-transpeptidase YcbB/YkuD
MLGCRLSSSRFPLIVIFALCGFGVLLGMGGAPLPSDDIETQLRLRIEAARAGSTSAMAVGEEQVLAPDLVAQYYRQNGFEPGWTGPDGPTPLADSLVAVLQEAHGDGLRPADYHVAAIDSFRRVLRAQAKLGPSMDARALADFELLCTDAFLLYGTHLHSGRVDPVELVPTWTLNRQRTDLPQHLQRALETGTIRAALHDLRPPQSEYAAFRRTLARYRTLAANGGWPTVPDGPTLKEGMQDERVPTLRERLHVTGEFAGAVPTDDSLQFGESLRRAVARFQERHGLDIDGVVGPATRAAMNVPVDDRIRQIEVNMERWRWLPRDLGNPHVMVNIADFWLRVVEDGANALQMRVVVGTQYRQTPIFSDRISYLVFTPYWHVPPRIAAEDKLPEFQRNPSLVSTWGFDVFQGWGADARAIDPSTIAWSSLSADAFPYRLRQRPGPYNALGRVKFMFPNRHNVYLHDTPSRSLFGRSARTFSSGCIRVEYPVELATYLLRENGGWTEERVEEAMSGDTERSVVLRQKVPVHLLYWTAWMENGTLHFRNDIYERDGVVAKGLASPVPSSFASSASVEARR